ncbi:H-NS family nucleoid-associated regulatory protein [Vibrio cholerae]|uniref:H-NS histone family protein n=1 Tax=Gammaproteobacteria TaxID=1236 RepID=UPI00058A1AF3|nr:MULTISPECIES: H-NS family nucleoid-associated regulatory protein [Gammaproteobacteria]EHW5331736.1 H-NS histone family protein [Escherichia coli]MDV2387310.1 H-NS family nucleoid-associated regulatory protein [Vibrio cholerae]
MTDFESIKNRLTNKRSFNAFIKTVDLVWLKDFQERIKTAINELEQEAETKKLEELERQERLNELMKLIQDEGFDIADILAAKSGVETQPKTRSKAEPKYQYTGENGEPKTWTGRGRMPLEIAQQIEKGGKVLDDFLIQKK